MYRVLPTPTLEIQENMKLAINSDAISQDFETAVLLGLEWGIEYFELKRIHGRRVPDITEEEIRGVEKVLQQNAARLSSIAPGLFKIPLDPKLIAQESGPRFDMTIALADRLNTRAVVIFAFVRDDDRPESAAIRQIIDILAETRNGNTHSYYLYVARHPARDRILEKLKERDIHLNISYPWPIHTMPAYQRLGYKDGSLPETEAAAKEIFSLPMYPSLTDAEQDTVCAALLEILPKL